MVETARQSAQDRREALLDTLYAKLDDPELPGHAFAKISGSIAALEKLIARDEDEVELPTDDLGAAFAAMPVEHAQELIVSEIARLNEVAAGYQQRLVELVGDEAAEEALHAS